MKNNQLSDSFASILSFFKIRETFQLGSLNHICKAVVKDISLLETSMENNIVQFLSIAGNIVRMKNNTTSKAQSLSLIVLQSLIFTLYSKLKKTDQLRLNNSFYHTLSMSQMSVQASGAQYSGLGQGQDEVLLFNNLLERLTKNKSFFRRLTIIYERHIHKNRNQRYLQNLLQTIQYILTKQGISKNDFYQNKKFFVPPVISKQQIKQSWNVVNQIIFSCKLNRIVFFLTSVNDQCIFALHRIYFAGMKRQDRRNFKKIKYSANDMVYNLIKCYIDSFDDMVDLFEQGKNPLYRFISTYLQCFFIPTFIQFNQFVIKCSKIPYDDTKSNFYRNAETLIRTQLVSFIHNLPAYLLQFLQMIYKLIQGKFPKNSSQANCIPVKRLLLYSFLAKSDLISDLFQQISDLTRFAQVCSFIVFLFFPATMKNYEEENKAQVQKLIDLISGVTDEMIVNVFPDLKEELGVENYFLQEPMINHDYELLYESIKKIEFTPKDLKQFAMGIPNQPVMLIEHKTYQSDLLQSPSLMRYMNKQMIQSPPNFDIAELERDEQQQYIDYLTYMTVGGSQDWTKTKKLQKTNKPANKLKFESFSKSKMKQVKNLYQQFQNISMNIR